MPNIQFNYLYRDAANYKSFGSVVIANPGNVNIEVVEDAIKSQLIDSCWFYTHKWQVPDLRFANINENDPTWHEFESLAYTEQITDINTGLLNYLMPNPINSNVYHKDHKR